MNTDFMIGDIVKSLSGHDKNRLFIIVSIDKNGYPAIIDGRYRNMTNPKIKNPKHLLKVAFDQSIIDRINSKLYTDTEIYRLIKTYKEKD